MSNPTHRPAGWIPDGPFARLGRWSGRRRRLVITVWIVLFAALAAFAGQLEKQLKPGGFEIKGATSEEARLIVKRDFTDAFPTSVTLVVSSDTLKPGDPAFDAVVANATRAVLADKPLVGGAVTPQQDPSLAFPQGGVALVQVGMTKNVDEALKDVKSVIDAADSAETEDVKVGITGGPAVFEDFNQVNKKDLQVSESIQIPFLLLILVIFFGSVIAAGVPIGATLVAIVTTMGGLYFLAQVLDLSIYVQNVVLLIGIGVGIDYSLFVASRFRDELREGRDPLDAAAVTGGTAGKAIFFSGLTVAVALAGMFAVGVPLFTGFAVGTIAVVFMAVAVGLTFTPALLVAIGPRLFKWDLRRRFVRAIGRTPRPPVADVVGQGFWVRWANWVMKRPWPVLIATSVVLLVLAAPALNMKVGSSGITALPSDTPSREALAKIETVAGPGAASALQVVATGLPDDPTAAGVPLAELQRLIAADGSVASVGRTPQISADGRTAIITVIPKSGDDSEDAQNLVGRILDDYAPKVPALTQVEVGGGASQNRDFTDKTAGNLPLVIGLVMVLTFIVLVVLFRSIVLPLKAVLMTLLSVLASYGVLTLVFQEGWLDSLLGFDHLGHVTSWVPAFLFSILFGLSMDYEVFLLSRIREHRDRGASDTEAVAAGLARTGRIISAAATIMVIVFLSFLTNRLIPIKELALGLAVAVFLDATLVRLLLVPAFMRLAGRWNWWLPGPLDRILPRIEE
ncbi:MAG: MMPL family transporter [Thermoleophilia bacterium]